MIRDNPARNSQDTGAAADESTVHHVDEERKPFISRDDQAGKPCKVAENSLRLMNVKSVFTSLRLCGMLTARRLSIPKAPSLWL